MSKSPSSSAEFYEALGLALSRWGMVEDALCDLFIRLVVCGLTGRGFGMGKEKELPTGDGVFLLGNVFYATTNWRGRLEMLSNLMDKLVTDQALLSEWNAIKNKSARLYPRRNVLAHGMAWSGPNSDPETMNYSIFSTQRQTMSFQQICAASASFQRYAERITKLAIGANAHLASRKRYPEDFPDQTPVN